MTYIAPCSMCGQGTVVHTVKIPPHDGGLFRLVTIHDCPRCDRASCPACRQKVGDIRAKRCPKCNAVLRTMN